MLIARLPVAPYYKFETEMPLALNLPLVLLFALWLPVLSFGLRYVEATPFALALKMALVGLFCLVWLKHQKSPAAWFWLPACFGGYWLWGVVLNGWLLGSVAFFAGLSAYAVMLYPLMVSGYSPGDDRRFVRHALMTMLMLCALGLTLGQNYRLVYPYADPNMVGITVAAILFWATYYRPWALEFKWLVGLGLLMLALLESRSAVLIADCLLLARILRAWQQGAQLRRFALLSLVFVVVTGYIFWVRGDFVGQQLDEGGRVNIAAQALASLSSGQLIFGQGLGMATNAFTNLKLHFSAYLVPELAVARSHFGGLDNTLVAAIINGGVVLLVFVLYAVFGWMWRARFGGAVAWGEACLLAMAVGFLLISLNLPEVWPGGIIILVGLWRWQPITRD